MPPDMRDKMLMKLTEDKNYDMMKGMGASYVGIYANKFKASSGDGNYRGKSTDAHKDFRHITREYDNQAGRDIVLTQ